MQGGGYDPNMARVQGRGYSAFDTNNRGQTKRKWVEPVRERRVRVKRPRTDYFPSLANLAADYYMNAIHRIQRIYRGLRGARRWILLQSVWRGLGARRELLERGIVATRTVPGGEIEPESSDGTREYYSDYQEDFYFAPVLLRRALNQSYAAALGGVRRVVFGVNPTPWLYSLWPARVMGNRRGPIAWARRNEYFNELVRPFQGPGF